MNGEEPIIGKLENEELEEVAGEVGADHENLRRVGVRVDIHDNNRAVDSVEDVRIRDAMTSGRAVNLHTIAAYYVKRVGGRGLGRAGLPSERKSSVEVELSSTGDCRIWPHFASRISL